MQKIRHATHRHPLRIRRPVYLFIICMVVSMVLIGAVAIAAVV